MNYKGIKRHFNTIKGYETSIQILVKFTAKYNVIPNMKNKLSTLLLIFLFTAFNTAAQEDFEDFEEEESDTVRFFFGLNFGVHFANKETASIYTGSPNITPFGIEYIFNQPLNRQEFDRYFRFPYEVAEYPFDPIYRSTSEIGLHFGYKLGKTRANAIYADVNITQLKFEQFFTVAIDDPQNNSVDPTFERIPIFGEENRFHLNLGTQISLTSNETSNAYIALYGNLNNLQMRRNFIVVNNREYDIFHVNAERPDQRLGGIGYGGGAGLGFKFSLSDQILADIYYNYLYSQSNFRDDFQPFNSHHSLGIRIIWRKTVEEEEEY